MKPALLLPRTQRDDAVLDRLLGLSAAGHLDPFLVVDPALNCQLVERGVRGEQQPLIAALATLGRIDLARIVTFTVDDAPVTPGWGSLLREIRSWFQNHDVRSTTGAIAALPAGKCAPAAFFETYWNYNIVVLPEDGLREIDTVPIPATDQATMVDLCANAVALCAGLWRWLEDGPLDDLQHAGGADTKRVRIGRFTTRLVDVGDVVTKVIESVFSPDTVLPLPTNCVAHGEPKVAVDSILRALAPADGSSPIGWTFRPLAAEVPRPRKKMGIFGAIAAFGREVGEELKPIPKQIVMGQVAKRIAQLEGYVQDRTYGEQSDIVVRLGSRSADEVLAGQAVFSDAAARLVGPKSRPLVPSPETWEGLVRVAMAALDGSELPDRLAAAQLDWDGRRAVVSDVDFLTPPVPTGSEVLFVSAVEQAALGVSSPVGMTIEDLDVATAVALRSIIEVRLRALDVEEELRRLSAPTPAPTVVSAETVAEVQETDSVNESVTAFPEEGESSPAGTNVDEVSLPGVGGEVSVQHNETAAPVEDLICPPDEIAVSRDESYRLRETIEGLYARLDAWQRRRSETLTWRLAEELHGARQRALDEIAENDRRLAEVREELRLQLEKSKKRRRSFLLKAFLVIALLVLCVAAPVVGFTMLSMGAALVLSALAGLGVLGVVFAIWRIGADRVRFNHRAEGLSSEPQRLAEKRAHAIDEYRRLNALWDQLGDWGSMLTHVLRQPWGKWEGLSSVHATPVTKTLSFVAGTASLSQSELSAMAVSITQRIVSQGWLERAYQERRSRWLAWFANQTRGLVGVASTPEADSSSGRGLIVSIPASDGLAPVEIAMPRVQFTRQMMGGDFAADYRNQRVTELHQITRDRNAAALVESVRCSVGGLDGRPLLGFLSPPLSEPNAANFSSPSFVSPTVRAVSHQSFSGWTQRLDIRPDSGSVFGVCDLDDRLVFATARIDLSEPLSVEAVLLVEGEGPLPSSAPARSEEPPGRG